MQLEGRFDSLGGGDQVQSCPFQDPQTIQQLKYREYPYWHVLLKGRHIGVHRQDDRICNWVARTLFRDGRYKQRCLGPALSLSKPAIPYHMAIERAFEWFETGRVKSLSVAPEYAGRVKGLVICPIGDIYTVGHALRDYLTWSKLARSPGGHYNNLTLMNYHLVPMFSGVPIEEFNAKHLQALAINVLERPPKRGFESPMARVDIDTLNVEEIRKRKRTFNSLVTILRMAFKYAWESGHLQSERSWKCLNRVSVIHLPRTIFLSRIECRKLIGSCSPALRQLVLAALYTGCRVGELGQLRAKDVAKDGFGLTVQPFKRGPARFVYLPDEGMEFFLEACGEKKPEDFVLLSPKGKPWRRQHTLPFRTASAKAGLPTAFVFHGLRHTYASDLIGRGASLETVAKQLGHANTLTVMNTYGHLSERLREAQVQECFSPLESAEGPYKVKNRVALKELRKRESERDWRTAGKVPNNSTLPSKPLSRPCKEVLSIFAALPGSH